MEAKEQATAIDTLAWSVGSYVVDAMAIFLDKNSPAYPSKPRSMNSTESAPPGAKMTNRSIMKRWANGFINGLRKADGRK